MEIEFIGSQQYLPIDPKDSAFPDEKEVLIQDGAQFEVMSSEKTTEDGKPLHVVKLRYIQDKFVRMSKCKRIFNLLFR